MPSEPFSQQLAVNLSQAIDVQQDGFTEGVVSAPPIPRHEIVRMRLSTMVDRDSKPLDTIQQLDAVFAGIHSRDHHSEDRPQADVFAALFEDTLTRSSTQGLQPRSTAS